MNVNAGRRTGVVLGPAVCLVAALSLGGCEGDCEEPGWAACEVDVDCAVVECGCCYEDVHAAVREECGDAWREAHGCAEDQVCVALYCPPKAVVCWAGRCLLADQRP